ncbi:tetratricopeptide repeat protein [Pseudorhodoferax sp.]|uniref:tetratricopeptide repeat protein n=1 Tax=Pseudorhodoferax sp. TaxID=1993553 RepID=UPI002DD6342B|nr:tetratricopeptide repeat protein [Pseudorhodoferax sp.]
MLRPLTLALAALLGVAQAATPLRPTSDQEVVERLPAVTHVRAAPGATAADPVQAERQARAAIATARQTGDARYWGRAQAALAPWWDRPDAPVSLAVLQATVQQGRHAFGDARQVLQAVLRRDPGHAQAWLDLAALERLGGRYPAALQACDAVARAGALLYAQACQLETVSLQGRHEVARSGLQRLLDQTAEPAQRGWLASLLAEQEERAGRDSAALAAYRLSLQAAPDLYTRIALADLLLRTGQPAEALEVLRAQPDTDAVLLRQALALRQRGDAGWTALRDSLRTRAEELARRGDEADVHAREQALAALWLHDEPTTALALARRNLVLQREPIDWWLALQSAQRASDDAALRGLRQELQASGLVDRRLAERAP